MVREGYSDTIPQPPLGGLDRLVHGSDGLKGWGSPASPDPVLYSVRGFDPAGERFRYAVNPNFGRSRETTREPFRLTIDVSLDWGRPLPVQQMERSLRPAPGAGRISADSLSRRYARSVPDLYAAILLESDSLMLSPEQTAALRAAQTSYRARVAAVLTHLSEYLAALPDRFDAAEALRRQEAVLDEAWEVGRLEGPIIRSILSPLQLRMLPGQVSFLINSPVPVRIRTYR